MKCNQSRPRFELESPCPCPTTITITPRAPPQNCNIMQQKWYIKFVWKVLTPQDTNCTATCLLSRKLFKLDEPDMQDTAGEAGTNS